MLNKQKEMKRTAKIRFYSPIITFNANEKGTTPRETHWIRGKKSLKLK